MDIELSSNISEILKYFDNKIVLNTKEYKDLVSYRELYFNLKKNFDNNLKLEIIKIEASYKDEIANLNRKIININDKNEMLNKQLQHLNDSKNKNKKGLLW